MCMAERKDQVSGLYRKLLIQSTKKIAKCLLLPSAEVCLDQNQNLSAGCRRERHGRERQRPMDHPSYVVRGRSPIASANAHWGCYVSARDADPAGERRMAKST